MSCRWEVRRSPDLSATDEPIDLISPLKLPLVFANDTVHRIETPAGPVNAKFKKVRGL
jgi:hypothetical protein